MGGGHRIDCIPMTALEQRIDYEFKNPELLSQALTHPSLSHERHAEVHDNQRMEFLGDAVLQLVLTEELYSRFPRFDEGVLTKLRSRLVSKDALSSLGLRLELGQFLLMGKGEHNTGGRERPSTLADAYEAVIGAVYLDAGIEAAKAFILHEFAESLIEIDEEPEELNPKGTLQETLQAMSTSSPSYEILSENGPDHAKTFRAMVESEGTELGRGEGASKKLAEIEAAKDALLNRAWEKESQHPCE